MKKILYIIAAAAIALTGCNKDDNGIDPGTGGNANGGDIVFNIGIANPGGANMAGGMTRTTTTSDFKTTFDNGDEVGIYAVRHASGSTGTLQASGNYIHNVKLTRQGDGSWAAATPIYYVGGNDQLDFYAYYPYDVAATDPTAITFNVLTDQSTAASYGKSDLLAANHGNVAKGTPVALTFAHQLALVQVEVPAGTMKGSGPNATLALTLRNCVPASTLNLGGAAPSATVSTTAQAEAIKMLRVEQPSDANYTATYTYRALVPAQTVASGAKLVLMEQDGQLYTTPALGSALTLTSAQAKLYTANLPFTIHTVPITAGTFLMGSSDGTNIGDGAGTGLNTTPAEPNRSSDETQHQVTLTKDFYMSKYAVTFGQYKAYCTEKGITPPSNSGWEGDDRPVINVSWNDAMAYCTWLSEQTGQTWTLPTEAQWEYACRAGTTTPFSLGAAGTGKILNGTLANIDGRYAYDADNGGAQNNDASGTYLQKTTAVGSYTPNAWGLYDMHGNVWEWCLDQWDGSDNYASLPDTDPHCTSGTGRVLRGGSWGSNARSCRSANRSNTSPGFADNRFGFRVVLVP